MQDRLIGQGVRISRFPEDESTMNLSPPRGTRDFFPEDLRYRNWLFGHFREVARLFALEEYDAPVVESEELYTR